ncbi:MFS transporter [Pseudooceanicola sp. C21-150M6]|uniref:MFS transporter n=1 Tax=Pseudooceanicola sp. C21-150M6 TaxID=3434355 RepID=UPI003D7F9092
MPLPADMPPDTPDLSPAGGQRARTVTVLGIVMILSWGSSFYLAGVFFGPMAEQTGWPMPWISAGFSLGLLISGLCSPKVGTLIQRHGGRRVLAAGMLALAAGLTLMALAPNIWVYLLAWAVTGLGMAAGLYDAAFSALGRLYGSGARSAITLLTLFGGFASTVCWPVSALLVEALGWRGALLVYAATHLIVTLPLCLLGIPRAETPFDIAKPDAGARPPGLYTDPRFWIIGLSGALLATIATILTTTLIPILVSQGATMAVAVGIGTLMGPAQVGARLLEMAGRGRHHPVWTMAACTALVAAGIWALGAGMNFAMAIVAFGMGNGLWSIARGALPLAIFGPGDYPRIMGRLAPMSQIASASGPWIAGALMAGYGAGGTLLALSVLALLPPLMALALAMTLRRG